MKKYLSILLSLIMMLSMLPMTTMASDYITNVDLNIEKPVAGEPLGWHKTATMVNNDSNYKVYQNADWYDETEKRYMKLTENFQSGHIYTVEIWVEAKDGYEFDASATAYNLKATLNGKEAKVSKAFEYQRWAMAVVSYTFPEVKDHKEITHVNVSDIIEPKIGRQSIARPHYLKYSEGVEGYDATWYENYQSTGANLVLPFTGVFAEKIPIRLKLYWKQRTVMRLPVNPRDVRMWWLLLTARLLVMTSGLTVQADLWCLRNTTI